MVSKRELVDIIMKRLLLFTAASLAAFQISAFAESDISISVNGEYLTPEQPPVVINDRTLVPVRAVCEAMGLEVDWDPSLQEVLITRDTDFVKLSIGYHTINANHFLNYIDAAPQLVNGVTCVPIRYVVEPFGATVQWDAKTRTVIVTNQPTDDVPPNSTVSGNTGNTDTSTDEEIENENITEEDKDSGPVISNPPRPSFQEKAFTFYAQPDEEWGFESSGRGYCWVCSYAMIITDATGEKVTPVDVAAYNIEKSEGGSGSYMASHFGLLEEYGLRFVPALDEDSEYFDYFETERRGATYFKAETEEDVTNALIEALERNPHGIMVRFEGYPHTLVATGYYGSEVYFNDPASLSMENVTFDKTCLARNFTLTDLSFVQAVELK